VLEVQTDQKNQAIEKSYGVINIIFTEASPSSSQHYQVVLPCDRDSRGKFPHPRGSGICLGGGEESDLTPA
jgi:hypothetical protein